MNISILYEDEDVLVINKPSGVAVHPDGRTQEVTLVDWVLAERPNMAHVGEPLTLSDGRVIDRPGIVHRLDRETSGVMVLAKNADSFLFLKEQFQNRTVAKTYRAFVYGEMKEEEGVIDRAIGKSTKDFRLWSAQRGAKGVMREAVTQYKTLARGNGYSYLELTPKTGRTHQLRVHLKAINHPIVSDRLYAPKRPPALGFTRVALHALSLAITLPSGERKRFEAPLPEEFGKALNVLV